MIYRYTHMKNIMKLRLLPSWIVKVLSRVWQTKTTHSMHLLNLLSMFRDFVIVLPAFFRAVFIIASQRLSTKEFVSCNEGRSKRKTTSKLTTLESTSNCGGIKMQRIQWNDMNAAMPKQYQNSSHMSGCRRKRSYAIKWGHHQCLGCQGCQMMSVANTFEFRCSWIFHSQLESAKCAKLILRSLYRDWCFFHIPNSYSKVAMQRKTTSCRTSRYKRGLWMSVSHAITWYHWRSWGEALAWQRIVWLPFIGWHWLTCPAGMTKSRKSSVWTQCIKKNHANHAIKAIKIQSKWHIVSFLGVSLCVFVDPPWHRALHIWTWRTNNLQNTGRCTDLRHAKFAQPPNHSCVRWIQNSVVEACPIPGRNSTVSKPIPHFCIFLPPSRTFLSLFVLCHSICLPFYIWTLAVS